MSIFKKRHEKAKQVQGQEIVAEIMSNLRPISEMEVKRAYHHAHLPTDLMAGDIRVTKYSQESFYINALIESLSHLSQERFTRLLFSFGDLRYSEKKAIIDHLISISFTADNEEGGDQ